MFQKSEPQRQSAGSSAQRQTIAREPGVATAGFRPLVLDGRSAGARGPLAPGDVLRLQGSIGNRAVGRLLAGAAGTAQARPVQRMAAGNAVVQRMIVEVHGVPGLYYDDESRTYLDGSGRTYDSIADYRRQGGSSSALQIEEDPLEDVGIHEENPAVAYEEEPDVEWMNVPRRDVRAHSPSGRYIVVYRFADATNSASMYPYPGEQDDTAKMEKMSAMYNSTFDTSGGRVRFRSDLARTRFRQQAELTVGYGRDDSPFIPVGESHHTLANHKNRLMQEIVRSPGKFERDPVNNEMPQEGKRAPHILRFAIPAEKAYLLFKTYEVNEQAASGRELEYFGPLQPYLSGIAMNPY